MCLGEIMTLLNKITEVLKTDLNTEINFRKKSILATTDNAMLEQLKRRTNGVPLKSQKSLNEHELVQLIEASVASCHALSDFSNNKVLILLGDLHQRYWQLYQDERCREVAASQKEALYAQVESAQSGVATVLILQDEKALIDFKKNRPLDANDGRAWTEQHAGMLQYAIWSSVLDAGLCADIYHLPLGSRALDQLGVKKTWILRAQIVLAAHKTHVMTKSTASTEIQILH